MKKGIIRATIALMLVFAMSIGMLASAAEDRESLWNGRGEAYNNISGITHVTNTAKYILYVDASAPTKKSSVSHTTTAKLRNATSNLTLITMNKEHEDVDDHWFYVYGNSDAYFSINTTSTSGDKENFYVYAREGSNIFTDAEVYVEAIDRTLIREGLILVRQKRFSSNSYETRTVNILINDTVKYTASKPFAYRGESVAKDQIDIEKVTTDTYYFPGSYEYINKTYNIPFYTRYTVEFDGNGATSGSTASQSFVWGTAQNLNKNGFARSHTVTYNGNDGTPSRESDTGTASFAGWTGEDNQAYTDGQNVNKLTGTSLDTFTMTAKWNFATTKLPIATRTGHTLEGWYDGNTRVGGAGDTYEIKSDKTLTAKWTANTYYVAFNGNGATSGSMSNQTFRYGTAQALTANAYEKKYSVTYSGNGGTSAKTSDVATATFNGWDSQNTLALTNLPYMYSTFNLTDNSSTPSVASAGVEYVDKQVVSNLTSVNNDTVTLVANWSAGNVTLPTAAREGHTFGGWYDGSTKVGDAGDVLTPSRDMNLTAQWTKSTFTVKWMSGEAVISEEEYEYNATPSYKGATPTKPNDENFVYKFKGWSTEISAVTKDTVYTAEFEAIPLKSAVSDLVIEVVGCKDETQSFIFKLTSEEVADFKPLEVAIVGNNRAKITDLTIGSYTITEGGEWSWRYGDVQPQTINISIDTENKVTFDFTEVSFIQKWLSGLAALFK